MNEYREQLLKLLLSGEEEYIEDDNGDLKAVRIGLRLSSIVAILHEIKQIDKWQANHERN